MVQLDGVGVQGVERILPVEVGTQLIHDRLDGSGVAGGMGHEHAIPEQDLVARGRPKPLAGRPLRQLELPCGQGVFGEAMGRRHHPTLSGGDEAVAMRPLVAEDLVEGSPGNHPKGADQPLPSFATREPRPGVAQAGGRTEIRSRPGEGTEVCLWLR